MKALSIRQPWAGLIAAGVKTIETRIWRTEYRGPLLICASRQQDKNFVLQNSFDWTKAQIDSVRKFSKITGKAIAVAELTDCRVMIDDSDDCKRALCDYYLNAYAWELSNIKLIKPFEVKGQLSLFDVDDEFIKFRK